MRPVPQRHPLVYFPEFCTIFQFSLFSRVTCEWQVVKKQKKQKTPTLPFTHFFPVSSDQWKDGSETQISFSVCHVVVLYKQYVWRLHIFQLGILQTHFFPACAAQSSKSVLSLWCKLLLCFGAIIGTKDVCSALSTAAVYTQTHTPTHLYFLTALCVHRANGVIQVSEVLAILRLTLYMLVRDKVLSNSDKCCNRQKLCFLYAGSFVEVFRSQSGFSSLQTGRLFS